VTDRQPKPLTPEKLLERVRLVLSRSIRKKRRRGPVIR